MPLPRAYIKFSICHSLFHIDMKKLCLLAGGEGGGYPMITIMSRSVLPSRCPQHLITALITAAASPGHPGLVIPIFWDTLPYSHPRLRSQAPAAAPQQLACKISANTRRHQLLLLLLQMGARHSARDSYSLQSHVKMARAKLRPIHFRTTWIENTHTTNQTVKYWHYF